jgi:hypothetical protein
MDKNIETLKIRRKTLQRLYSRSHSTSYNEAERLRFKNAYFAETLELTIDLQLIVLDKLATIEEKLHS